MEGSGLITKIYSWIGHASNSEGNITEWFAGLVVILVISFLWSTVIRSRVEM